MQVVPAVAVWLVYTNGMADDKTTNPGAAVKRTVYNPDGTLLMVYVPVLRLGTAVYAWPWLFVAVASVAAPSGPTTPQKVSVWGAGVGLSPPEE